MGTLRAVCGTLEELRTARRLPERLPVWIEAEVVRGPEAEEPRLPGSELLERVNQLYATHDATTACLAWTVGNAERGTYSPEMIAEMITGTRARPPFAPVP
jgi:hypothetical protein